jgi:two-component system, OmpR family, alkaline phosphatase synthesis response regulator PhoP
VEGALRILLAEDDRILRKAGEVSLRKKGYEVIPAVDGADALARARDQKPDLILLDVMMPGMNGFDVLDALKADRSVRDIPVIMLTNLETPADIKRAADAGAHSYLVKSNMNLDELSGRIADALSHRAHIRQQA